MLAQYSWAVGSCVTAGAKRNCEIQVGSPADWNGIDDDIVSCAASCGNVDTVKVLLTADVAFGDNAPDFLCTANVTPVKTVADFVVTSKGETPFTLSNGCLKNESDANMALFLASNQSFTVSNVNFENFYVDSKNAKNAAFILARGDRMVNMESVSLKNISLKSDFGSENTGLLVATLAKTMGSVGATVSKVRGENLSIVSESAGKVGGLVGFSECAVTVTYSNIEIAIERNRNLETLDNTRSAVGGLIGSTSSRVQISQDTVSVKVDAVDVYDTASMVGGLVGYGVGSSLNFVMNNSIVTGEVNALSKKNDFTGVRERLMVGGLLGCWSVQGETSNMNVKNDSVAVNVLLSGVAGKNVYVGGLVGYADALGGGTLSSKFTGILYNGSVNVSDSEVEKVYAGGVMGGLYASKNAKVLMDTVQVNALVYADGGVSNVVMGGFAGLIEDVDSLKISRSFAWGLEDYLLYVKASGGNDVLYNVGGAIGFLNKARSSEITEVFARGAIAVFGGKKGDVSGNKVMAGFVGLVENEAGAPKTKIQDVYYVGGFSVTSNAKSNDIYGLVFANGETVDLNAAYAVDFYNWTSASANFESAGVVTTVNEADKSVASKEFADRLNELDDAWIWNDTLNEGFPQLKFFAEFDGGKFDPKGGLGDDVVDPSTDESKNPPADEPEEPSAPADSLPLYVQVWTSGNLAKMSVEFFDVDGESKLGPVYARLLNADGKTVVEKLLSQSLESEKFSEDFGQLEAGEYRVEICADSAESNHCAVSFGKTETWKVQEFVNREGSAFWQMVALSAIDPDFSKFDGGDFYRWDEADAIGDYWQYKAFDGVDEVLEGEGGWFYAASGINLPAKKYDLKTESDTLVWNLQNKYSGWNMVANPYPWKIRVESTGDFDDAENGAEPLWFWNDATESYEALDTLPAFGAFWLHSDEDNAVRSVCAAPVFSAQANIELGSSHKVAPPAPLSPVAANMPADVYAPVALAKKATSSSWSLRLVLKGEDGSVDRWNVIGAGSRNVSIEEPPAGMGRGVKLSIMADGQSMVRGKALAKSVVVSSANFVGNDAQNLEYSWTVALSAGDDGVARFSAEGLDKLESAGLKAVLELDGKTYALKSGSSVKVEVSSETRYAQVKVVPVGAHVALAGASVSNLGFTNFGTSLHVSFVADDALDGSLAEVRLVAMNGHTVALARGTVRGGANSLNVAAPGRGGVYVLHVRAAGKTRSVKIRI